MYRQQSRPYGLVIHALPGYKTFNVFIYRNRMIFINGYIKSLFL